MHRATDQLGAMGLSPVQAAGAIVRQIVNQAYFISSVELFRLCAWMTLLMIPVIWFCRRPAPTGHVVAAD